MKKIKTKLVTFVTDNVRLVGIVGDSGDQRVNGAANKDNEPNGQRHDHGLTRRPGPLSESAAMVRCGGRERTALCEGPRKVRKSVLVVAALTGSSPVVKTGGDAV